MSKLDLSHLLEEPDIHAVYLERWRAEHLTKELWRLTNERVSWQRLALKPHNVESGGGGDRKVAPVSAGPRFLPYEVPAVAVLDFLGEHRLLWSTAYREALGTLTRDERHAWDEHMLRGRYSAVFAVVYHHAMVKRSTSASRELANAALKISSFSETR